MTHYLQPFVKSADGRNLPVLMPRQKLGRRVSGLALLGEDLSFCARCFEYLSTNHGGSEQISTGNTESELVARGVWLGAIATYGKCFVSADGRGVVLKRADVEALGLAFVERHDHMMTMRHEYVTHGGTSLQEHGLFGIAIESVEPRSLISVAFSIQARMSKPTECAADRDLCVELRKLVTKRFDEAAASFEAEVNKLPKEELEQFVAASQPALESMFWTQHDKAPT